MWGWAVIGGVGTLLALGCSSGEAPDAVEQATPPVATVAPVVSVNALMVALVDHASHELWNVEKDGGAPTSDADWREVEHHAIQLAGSGTLIALGGTGQPDPGWAKLPGWPRYSQQLNEVGLAAAAAARDRNLEALVKANGRLVEVCEGCHKEFKPDLPSEGIVHPHEE
jgi:hypothetical protein